jgi:hypothetical protein
MTAFLVQALKMRTPPEFSDRVQILGSDICFFGILDKRNLLNPEHGKDMNRVYVSSILKALS